MYALIALDFTTKVSARTMARAPRRPQRTKSKVYQFCAWTGFWMNPYFTASKYHWPDCEVSMRKTITGTGGMLLVQTLKDASGILVPASHRCPRGLGTGIR